MGQDKAKPNAISLAIRPGTPGPKSLTVVGMGNIGSHVATLMSRIPEIGRITMIDFDQYERKNLSSQDVGVADVGKPKVLAQARRLARIHPTLDVRPMCARVEELPLGLLRSDVIVACLDSRLARQYVNRAAWRLGVPWIDAGIDASGLLARVNVYVPGPENCCLECAWDANDYAATALEQPYPCDATGTVAATNAPASLGAVAAGIMAIELQKWIHGETEHVLVGRQVLIDLRNHTHYVTALRRNAQCRFDHRTWNIETLDASPSGLTLARAFRLASGGAKQPGYALGMEGHYFARMQYCPGCGDHVRTPLVLADRLATKGRVCTECGTPLIVRGFDMTAWLDAGALENAECRRSLSSLGFRTGDVFTVCGPDGDRYFELRNRRSPEGSARRDRRATALAMQ